MLYALTILSVIAVVVSENRNPVKSLAWVTVLLVVPVVGLVPVSYTHLRAHET